MRLTILLVIVGCLHAGAKGRSQTITLHRQDSPLETVLNDIHRQTGYSFVYNLEWLSKVPKVTLSVERATLTETLDQLLIGQPLSYTLIDKTVVLRWQPKPPPVPSPNSGDVGDQSVSDMVTLYVRTSQGQALSGASVFFKHSNKGVITGANGQFSIGRLTVEDTLIISYIGYKTRTISIANLVQTTFPVILMEPSDDKLDQAVVQAYGTTSQRLSTGNITKVSGEEIAKQPVSNPLLALQGRVAGLDVTATSSYGSAPVKLEIRGRSTINPALTSEPLIIIDGVQMNSLNADGLSSYDNGSLGMVQNGLITPAGGQSPFFGLNAADIESISVLKDAAATAIYGSRGGSGVILIVTKRGQANLDGATSFTADYRQGFSRPTGRWKLLDTKDYLAMRHEAYANDGRTPTIFDAADLLLWDTTRHVDWQQEIYGGRKSRWEKANMALSGGDARTQFYISGTYSKQTALLLESGADQNGSLDFSMTEHSKNNKFTISLGGSYMYNSINNTYMPGGVLLPPNAPPVYNQKNELNYGPWDSAGIGYLNPFSSLKTPYHGRSNNLNANLRLAYVLSRGLVLDATVSYRSFGLKQVSAFPKSSMDPATGQGAYALFGDNSSSQYTIEPHITYNIFAGPGKLTVIAGGTIQRIVADGIAQYALGFTSDALMGSIQNAATVLSFESYAENRIAGAFARLTYNIGGKYIVEMSGRRDGSSRFGPGRQFGNFGSGSFAWEALEEKWLKKLLPKSVSLLKFRGSYGIVGSDNVQDYQYLSQWSTSTQMYSYAGITPVASQHAVNQDYHWQTTKSIELGMDAALFRNNLSLSVSYYRRRCDNQLTSFPTPVFSGFNTVVANWPANVQNAGLEFVLTGRAGGSDRFHWEGTFNISFNRNKLLSYPDIERSPYVATYKVGKPLNSIPLFHWTGIDPATGKHMYEDFNHDGSVSADYSGAPGTGTDDRAVFFNTDPPYFGGMTHSFGYKAFSLALHFSYYKQKRKNAFYGAATAGGMSNISQQAYNGRWSKPGDKAQFPRLTTSYDISDGYFSNSDGVYTDASFIRLTSMELSYKLPRRVLERLHMTGCQFFIETSNLFTITGYKGLDPALPYFGYMPSAKTIAGGVTINF